MVCFILFMWLELYVVLVQHSSEISGLCSMKCPSETLQNFGLQKYTYFFFLLMNSFYIYFSLMNALLISLWEKDKVT